MRGSSRNVLAIMGILLISGTKMTVCANNPAALPSHVQENMAADDTGPLKASVFPNIDPKADAHDTPTPVDKDHTRASEEDDELLEVIEVDPETDAPLVNPVEHKAALDADLLQQMDDLEEAQMILDDARMRFQDQEPVSTPDVGNLESEEELLKAREDLEEAQMILDDAKMRFPD